jgi:hypothetical protein
MPKLLERVRELVHVKCHCNCISTELDYQCDYEEMIENALSLKLLCIVLPSIQLTSFFMLLARTRPYSEFTLNSK